MTNEQIIDCLKAGEIVNFGMHRRNGEVMNLMAGLEKQGLIVTEDASLSQETRRSARWVGPTEARQCK